MSYCGDCGSRANWLSRYNYYCSHCYEKTKTDLEARTRDWYDLKERVALYDGQLVTMKSLEEKVAFLGKWSLPWEDSAKYCTGVVSLLSRDGSRFLAETSILSNRSDVFRAMLLEVDMKDKQSREVVIQEVGGESLKAFLKFLYTAQLSDEEMHSNYKELVKLAHLYQVKLLLSTLDKFISKHVLKKDSLIEALKLAYLYDLETTKRAAQNFIAEDAKNELLDMAMKELEVDDQRMAYQFSKDIIILLKKRSASRETVSDRR